MRRIAATLTLALATGAIAGCGGGSTSAPPTIVSGGIAYFIVTAGAGRDTVAILPGNTVQLSGIAYDGSLDPLALVGDTVWVSRNPAFATVNAHGLVTTVAAGSTWVVGTFTPANTQTGFADSVWINVVGQN